MSLDWFKEGEEKAIQEDTAHATVEVGGTPVVLRDQTAGQLGLCGDDGSTDE